MTLLFSLIWGLAAGWLGIYLLEEGNTLLAYVALAFASVCGYYALSNIVAILRSLGGPELKCANCGVSERLKSIGKKSVSDLYIVEIGVGAGGDDYGALVCFSCEHYTRLMLSPDGAFGSLGAVPIDGRIYDMTVRSANEQGNSYALKKIKSTAIGRLRKKEARKKWPIRELSVMGLCIGLIGLLGYVSSRPTTEIKGAEPNQGRTTPDMSNLLKPFRPWLPPSNAAMSLRIGISALDVLFMPIKMSSRACGLTTTLIGAQWSFITKMNPRAATRAYS